MRLRLLTLICLMMLYQGLQVSAKELKVEIKPSADCFIDNKLTKENISIDASSNPSSDKLYYRWYKDHSLSFSSPNFIKRIEFLKEGKTGSNTYDLSGIILFDDSQLGTITSYRENSNCYATWEYASGTKSIKLKNNKDAVWFTKIIVTLDIPVIDGTNETASNNSFIKDADGQRELKVAYQRKFVADGGWYTLCLPFYRTINQVKWAFGDEVEVYWFNSAKCNEDGTVQLCFGPYSGEYPIVAGKPCLIKPSKNTDDETIFSRVNIHFTSSLSEEYDGVRFVGTYDPMAFPSDDGNKYAFLYGKDGLDLAVDDGTGGKIKGTRAYFVLPSGALAVGSIVLNETDDIETVRLHGEMISDDDSYYTLSGLCIQGKPTVPGIYIHGGRKIVIR